MKKTEFGNLVLEPSTRLKIAAKEEWEKLLLSEDSEFAIYRASREIHWDEEIITLNTDQCVFLFMEFAEHVGLDVERFGRQLHSEGKSGRFMVGIAFRTILEVEGYYVERPNFSSMHRVPREVLVTLGAAILGIATAQAGAVSPEVGGAISGIGSLLINLLSARAVEDKPKPFDFYGEFILKLLDPIEPVSMTKLQEQTKFHETVLRKIIADLEEKDAIRRVVMDAHEIGLIRHC